MIKYNANAPEISDKPQYDVLHNFAVWSIVFGSFLIIWFGIFLLSFLSSLFRMNAAMLFIFAAVIILYMLLIVFVFRVGRGILSKKAATPAYVVRYSNIFTYIIIGVFCWLLIFFFWQAVTFGYTPLRDFFGFALKFVLSLAPTVLLLYLLWALKNTFKQPFIIHYHSLSKFEEPNGFDTGEGSDPRIITLFDDWSPLYGYGRFLFYLGISMGVTSGLLLINLLMERAELLDRCLYNLLFIAFGLVISVSGYGLSKQKEWGRMMTVLIHVMIMILPLFGCSSVLWADIPMNQRIAMFAGSVVISAFLFPIYHWCYFVIRTLTSPVVRYVCLRGGYDID